MNGEYLDIYNDNKEKTGKKVFREKGKKFKLEDNENIMIVQIFIENSKGEYLLQMTSPEKGSEWATTGGHVKSGQTSMDAILAEMNEELGLEIKPDEVEFIKTYRMKNCFKEVFYMKKDIDLGKLIYQEDEVDYCKYLTIDEIIELINNDNMRKSNVEPFLDIVKEKLNERNYRGSK